VLIGVLCIHLTNKYKRLVRPFNGYITVVNGTWRVSSVILNLVHNHNVHFEANVLIVKQHIFIVSFVKI
jgi:hypothetical protein